MVPGSPSPSDSPSQPVSEPSSPPPERPEESPDEALEPTWMGLFGIGMSVICGGGLAAAVVWILLSGFVALDPAQQPNPPEPTRPEPADLRDP